MRPTAVLLCVATAACAGACWWGDPLQQHNPDPFGGPDGGLDIDIDLPDGSIRLPDGGWVLPDGGPWDGGPRDGGPRDGGPQDAGPDAGPKLVEGCYWDTAGAVAAGRAVGTHPLLALPEGLGFLAFGARASDQPNAAALYAPSTGAVLVLPQQPQHARSAHSAVALPDGDVLYVGGLVSAGSSATPAAEAELFDRQTGTWSSAGSMPARDDGTPRIDLWPALVALPDGWVLVLDTQSKEAPLLWSPGSRTFTRVPMPPRSPRDFVAVALPDGGVLVAGGLADEPGSSRLDATYKAVWRYARGAEQWVAAGSLGVVRARAGAVLLPDGRVLVVGGVGAGGSSASGAELYDPATGQSAPHPGAPSSGDHARATLLSDGRVLVVGGLGRAPLSDLFLPGPDAWRRGPDLPHSRLNVGLAALDDGSPVRAAVSGGMDTAGSPVLPMDRLVCP